MENSWICTDPDSHQYARRINEHTWEYRESDDEGNTYKGEIDLWDYDVLSDSFWSDYMAPYGYTCEMLSEWGDEERVQMMCECIFEQDMLTDFAPDEVLFKQAM